MGLNPFLTFYIAAMLNFDRDVDANVKCEHTLRTKVTAVKVIHEFIVGVSDLVSLICKSDHKASAARCHLEHQATSRQPAIWALC